MLGHIAINRDNVMCLIGGKERFSEEQRLRYSSESKPIVEDGPDVMQLEKLLEILSSGQARLASMEELSETDLLKEIQLGEWVMPLGTRLYGFYFHDTYHVGQVDLLRQVAGANDKVV